MANGPEDDDAVRARAMHAFNATYLSCIKRIKGVHEDVRAYFKKHMKVFHKDSDQYVREFWDNLGSHIGDDEDIHVTKTPAMLDRKLIGDLNLRDIVERASESEHPTIEAYVHVLATYAYLYNAGDPTLVDAADRYVELLSRGEDTACVTDTVLDDRASAYLRRVAESHRRCSAAVEAAAAAAPPPVAAETAVDHVEEIFNNSRLGQMAKEISASIDLADLGIDATTAASLTQENALTSLLQNEKAGQMLGQVISKVGQSISSRLETGEMTHMDLVQDAIGMMTQLGSLGAPLGRAAGSGRRGGAAGVGDLVKNMAALFAGTDGAPAGAGADLLKTAVDVAGVRQKHGQLGSMIRREEMRKRLEERRAGVNEASSRSKTARSPR